MSKIYAAIALGALLTGTASFAADTKTKSTDAAKPDTTSASPAPAAGKHPHEHGAGKKQVLALSSLTDKQKAQLNTIYGANQAQWDTLLKQMRDLHEAEWAKVKPVLTADQITELRSEHHKRGGGGGGGGGAAPAEDQ